MKILCSSLTMSLILATPIYSGTAVVPHYWAQPQSLTNRLVTAINVANVSNSLAHVAVTLYNIDGSLLIGQPVRIWTPNITLQYSYVNTDFNGQILIDLPSHGKTQILILGDPTGSLIRMGHGLISGTPITGNLVNFLVAHCTVVNYDGQNVSNNYTDSVPINGGNPF